MINTDRSYFRTAFVVFPSFIKFQKPLKKEYPQAVKFKSHCSSLILWLHSINGMQEDQNHFDLGLISPIKGEGVDH